LSNGKANTKRTQVDILKELRSQQAKMYGLERRNFAGLSPSSYGFGGSSVSKGTGSKDQKIDFNFLNKSGDLMIGPLGLKSQQVTISGGEIDIGQSSGNFIPQIIILPETGTTDTLVKIKNPIYEHQLLFLQGVSGNTITLQHTASETAYSIRTPDGGNYDLVDNAIILVQYDDESQKWALVAYSATGGGGANNTLSNLITTSINQSLLPSATNLHNLGSSSLNWKDIYMRKIFLGASPVASTGILNLPNAQYIKWRNSGNTGDFGMRLNTDEQFQFEGSLVPNVDDTNDLGDVISGLRWRDLNLTRYFSCGSSAVIGTYMQIGGDIIPSTDNTSDLGASTLEFRDLYIDGTAKIDTLQVDAIASFSGTSCAISSSNITLGDTNSDDLYILARVKSDIEPDADATYDLGSSSLVWNFCYGANIAIPEKYAAGSEPTGKANTAILFCRDNGAGKTQLRVKFNTGTSVLIATEP